MAWTGAWPSLELVQLRDSFDRVVKLVVAKDAGLPDEISRALSRFLIVRACGYLEQASEEACRSYVASKTIPRVGAYGASWLGRGANPTPDHLVGLVRRFDSNWADDLAAFLKGEDELLWRELSFLVDRRNKIAHGLGEEITARKALDLADHARTTAEWFVGRFDPR